MIKAVIVQPGWDGEVSLIELAGELREYQTLVGGYIEILSPSRESVAFIVNEDGKVLGLPINQIATSYLYDIAPEYIGYDVLVGAVIIVGEGDDNDATSAPLETLRRFDLGAT